MANGHGIAAWPKTTITFDAFFRPPWSSANLSVTGKMLLTASDRGAPEQPEVG